MQRETIVIVGFVFLTSCSVSRLKNKSDVVRNDINSDKIEIRNIERQNVTSESFYIQKADVEIISKNEKQNFIVSIKFHKPDSFLISVRSNTGIEAAKIFLTSDTIIINDRINKTLFYGTKEGARCKYGFSSGILPLFLGDIVVNEKDALSKFECFNGNASFSSCFEGIKVNYEIDCNIGKSESMSVVREMDTKPVQLWYGNYIRLGNLNFARKVTISNLNNLELVKVKYSKILLPWNGAIEFIPGKNYELVEIR